MAYYNSNNSNFYSAPSASGEFDGYPFLNHMSAIEESNVPATYDPFTDPWAILMQPGPVVDSTASLQASASYAPTVSYETLTDGYGQLPYPGHYWPAVDQWPRDYHSSFSGQGSIDHPSRHVPATPEISTVVPGPSSVPLDYWGINQSGPFANTFYAENVYASNQPSTGPTRTGLMAAGRFQPYGTSRTRPYEYGNAGAGPSTLTAPPVPYVDLSTSQPSGGIPETAADAESTQTSTEEDETSAPKRTKVPHGQGALRTRVWLQKDSHKLRNWVQRYKSLRATPTINEALAIAVEIIPTIRQMVYSKPRLVKLSTKPRTTVRSKRAEEEHERRMVDRELYQELSRYYPLRQGREVWVRPELLSNVLKDLETHPVPEPPKGSHP